MRNGKVPRDKRDHGSEQKSGDNGGEEAEQHFVDVPITSRKGGGQDAHVRRRGRDAA